MAAERPSTWTATMRRLVLSGDLCRPRRDQACIGCHNAHPRSPKKDFKLDDVMGGLVIEIPLEK